MPEVRVTKTSTLLFEVEKSGKRRNLVFYNGLFFCFIMELLGPEVHQRIHHFAFLSVEVNLCDSDALSPFLF